MSFFDAITNFFYDDGTGYPALQARRKKVKENFKKQLKEQLFMNEEEASAVILVIEKYEEKIDNIQADFNPYNHSMDQADEMYLNLQRTQNEMINEVKGIINFLMRNKVEQANKILGDDFHS